MQRFCPPAPFSLILPPLMFAFIKCCSISYRDFGALYDVAFNNSVFCLEASLKHALKHCIHICQVNQEQQERRVMKAFSCTVDATTVHLLTYVLHTIKMVKIISVFVV